MMIRAAVTIKGSLCGELFTRHVARIAAEIKVSGWVRSCGDGSVEACFEGRRRAVEAMISWCFVGPRQAQVDEVMVKRKIYRGTLCGFRIMVDNPAASLAVELQQVDSWRGSTAVWRANF